MSAHTPIHVLVNHESGLLRAGLAALLREQADWQVSTNAEAGEPVDVLVTDYTHGLHCLGAARREPHDGAATPPKVLIVAPQGREWEIRHAMARGVHGYFLLDCPADKLLAGVRALARGARSFDPAVTATIADCLIHPTLTQRESDVLDLMVQGAGNKEIAKRLDIALGTVKTHVRAILEKLQAQTRTQAAAVAEQRGLLRQRPAWDRPPARVSAVGLARQGQIA
jgi:DNA-binding NarL/FixJ family response regulator